MRWHLPLFLLLTRPSLAATAVGPDGSFYVLGIGRINPTENAWIRTDRSHSWLSRFERDSGRAIFVTYLPFFPTSLAVDARGAAVMIGPPEPGSRERAILRVSPDGSRLESRIPLFFEGPSGSEIDIKVAVGPDGSVYGAISTAQDGLPVSEGGSRKRGSHEVSRDIYFFRVTADGQQLLYATYLGGDENEEVSALVVDRQGEVFLGGTTRSQNFPVTPGAFRGRVAAGVNLGGFVARWSTAANAFRYVSVFTPEITGLGVALAPTGDGGVVVGSFFASIDATPNAFAPISPDGGFVMRLNPEGTAPVFATGIGDDTRVEDVTVDADGSIAVAGETRGGPRPLAL